MFFRILHGALYHQFGSPWRVPGACNTILIYDSSSKSLSPRFLLRSNSMGDISCGFPSRVAEFDKHSSTQWFDNRQNKVNWTTTYEEWSYEQKIYRNKPHNMYTYTITYLYTPHIISFSLVEKNHPVHRQTKKKHYPRYHNSLVGTSERIQTLQFTEHWLHVLVGQGHDGSRWTTNKHKLCSGTT